MLRPHLCGTRDQFVNFFFIDGSHCIFVCFLVFFLEFLWFCYWIGFIFLYLVGGVWVFSGYFVICCGFFLFYGREWGGRRFSFDKKYE